MTLVLLELPSDAGGALDARFFTYFTVFLRAGCNGDLLRTFGPFRRLYGFCFLGLGHVEVSSDCAACRVSRVVLSEMQNPRGPSGRRSQTVRGAQSIPSRNVLRHKVQPRRMQNAAKTCTYGL